MATIESTGLSTPVKITTAVLARFEKLEAQRLALKRRADKLKTEQDQILEAAFTTAKETLGRKFKPGAYITVGKFKIEVGTGARRVAWKDEFVARLGAEAADKITNLVKPPLTISITSPGPDQT